MSRPVRTRIAPSPTGDPHVGTAYIALFNLCFARQQGGQFILRIEDTDQVRSTAESESDILHALRWLGLDWDEGPDVGGPHAPYRQSERSGIYRGYAEKLVVEKKAFYCFRTPDELEEIRLARQANGLNPGIKGDLELPESEVQLRLAANQPYVIRMKVPDDGVCFIQDKLRGAIEIEWSQVDCQVLLKSDGLPTYHLANVVDDHLMEITHVIRGEEWISSAPKHQLLYQYFGWDMPELCHMPLLRNPDKSKLSKRKNPTSISFYERLGVLPEALLNYLGRMGWSMPDESEKFTLAQMIEAFDIQRVSLGGPVFDIAKLKWLNGLWIRENLDAPALFERLQSWGLNSERWLSLMGLLQGRIETLSDVVPMAAFMFGGYPQLTEASFAESRLDADGRLKALQYVLWALEAERNWTKEAIFANIRSLAKWQGVKIGDYMQPVFVAIAGSPNSWSVIDSMALLGPDLTRARLRNAIEVLGGLSKKGLKKLEKEFEERPLGQ
jgi:glutamyl-tRNA synthetase